MKSFKIYTLGCKANYYDSGCLINLLTSRGLTMVEQDADLVIINTCSVTKAAGSKNSRSLSLAKRLHPRAKIVMVGCWPRVYPETMERYRSIDWLQEQSPQDLMRALVQLYHLPEPLCPTSQLIGGDRARYFLKIQDGCQQFCSYCVIPYARGALWSRPMNEVLAEVRAAEMAGFQETILTGIHLGLYGAPHNEQTLLNLLRRLLVVTTKMRFRLSSIEPVEVTQELLELMAAEPRFCRHLHLSLQSGSDRILKLMNRPYERRAFIELCQRSRRLMPDLAITTDVIVGFPSESEADFQLTVETIDLSQIAKVHVFAFSAHPKAAAAKFPKQLTAKVIKERSIRLRALNQKWEDAYLRQLQPPFSLVVLGKKNDLWLGKDSRFFDVAFTSAQVAAGDLRRGRLVHVLEGDILGFN